VLSIVRYVVAAVAVAAYLIAAWSPDMPEAIWRLLAAGIVVGLATGTWWALPVALLVAIPILSDGINDDTIPDFDLIVFEATAGALSIGLGVGLTKLAGALRRKRDGASASEGA
jgi:hypothetical protein